MRDLSVIAYLGVSLRMPDGSLLGSLCAIGNENRDWEPEEISALWDLAQNRNGRDRASAGDGQAWEAESKQKLVRELHERVKDSLASVQSIVDMRANDGAAAIGLTYRESPMGSPSQRMRSKRLNLRTPT